jgi:hypothetical protein
MPLQRYDGVVTSVLQLRKVFPDKTDEEYAAWYEQHFMVTERRVLGILKADREANEDALPAH